MLNSNNYDEEDLYELRLEEYQRSLQRNEELREWRDNGYSELVGDRESDD